MGSEDGATAPSGRSADSIGKRGLVASVVKSSRPREISKRKAYFDFERLEGSALSPRFFKANPGMKKMVEERRKLEGKLRGFRAMGLAGRHPDVVGLTEKIEPLEKALVSGWKSFQAEREKERGRR